MTGLPVGTRVEVATDLHPRCPAGRPGIVVACPCGLTHGDTVTVKPDGTKSRYRFAVGQLHVVAPAR